MVYRVNKNTSDIVFNLDKLMKEKNICDAKTAVKLIEF